MFDAVSSTELFDRFLHKPKVRFVFSGSTGTEVSEVCAEENVSLLVVGTRLIALRDGRLVYEGEPQGFNAETFKEIYGEEAEVATGLART